MKRNISFGGVKVDVLAKYYVNRALNKSWLSEGKNTKEFERLWAREFGYKHSIAVSSGTSACTVALMTLYDFGARRGDNVIVPACTFVATANAVLAAGFIPKFVDIELDTLNINPGLIEQEITSRTVAIMPVHLMGKPCNMDKIMKIAHRHGLKVIEDCCEAHGAKYKDKFVGSIGDMGVFSFYAAHIVCSGEGGMVVTNDDNVADLVRSIKSHGRPFGSVDFNFQRYGLNFKTNDLCSGIGIEGVSNFKKTFNTRKDNLNRLLDMDWPIRRFCYLLKEEKHELVSPHAFPMVFKDGSIEDRNILMSHLKLVGIDCKNLFGSLPTQHKAFEFLGYKLMDFPVSEFVGHHGCHVGCHQFLSDEDIDYISDSLFSFFKRLEPKIKRGR